MGTLRSPSAAGTEHPRDEPVPQAADPPDDPTADPPAPTPGDPQPSPDQKIHDPPAPAQPDKPGPILFDENETAR